MSGKFRRIAVLGVTSLGTWAVVPAPAPAEPVPKAASAPQSERPDGVRGQPRVEQPER
jgi:hypothetical protein